MKLPFLFQSGYSIIMYLMLFLIISLGLWQFFQIKTNKVDTVRSLVPIGVISTCLGIIAYFMQVSFAFDALAEAGDISPALVAGALSKATVYLILGMLTLATSYLFRFVNQK